MPDTNDPSTAAYSYPLLIKQLLHTPLATQPEQHIVHPDQTRYNYWTLRHRIGQLSSALRALGIGHGDTVAVMDWDSHRYLESYFAIPMMGAVLMTVNVRLSPEQIAYTLNHAQAKAILIHADFLPVLAQIRAQLETVDCFVLIDDGADVPLPSGFVDRYETMLSAASPEFQYEDFDEHTRATTFYTSGTTGLPKGVFFSHRQIVLHTLSVATALASAATQGRVHRDDVYLPLTPMFHVHAWGMPFVATLLGLKQVYPGRYVPEQILRLIAEEGVTLSHGVPTLLNMLLSHPASQQVNLSGWKMIVGGSALPQALAQQALARGIDVFVGYGMSETCPILAVAQLKTKLQGDAQRELDCRTKAGMPVPLVDLRVVDDQMRDVPHDGKSSGEVVVRAPWATQGYYQNPEATQALWADGYLHTNDIGAIDGEGYLQITDRIKDVIKTGGEWVSSIEVEDLISRHPAVAEAAVIGVNDARWGERPLGLVVLKPGQATDAEAIRQHLRAFVDTGRISKYAIPERVLMVDALDKTSVGKLNKRALRERFQTGEG